MIITHNCMFTDGRTKSAMSWYVCSRSRAPDVQILEYCFIL